MRQAGFIVLVLLSLGVAGYAVVAYAFFPLGALLHPDMRAAFLAHPFGVYAHVFGSVAALAAVMLRIYLPAAIASGIAFETAYPVIAWLCWVPNLVVAELLFNHRST